MDLHQLAQLEDPNFYVDDPYPVFARMRSEEPVFRYQSGEVQFWALMQFENVREVSRNTAVYSSAHGNTLGDRRLRIEAGKTVSEGLHTDGSKSMLSTDGSVHAALRGAVARAFTPRMVAKLEHQMRCIVSESLAAVRPGVPFDFVDVLAAPLPMYVVGDLLGVPRVDRPMFKRWADNMTSAASNPSPDHVATMAELQAEMFAYFAAKLGERRLDPQDDLMSVVAHDSDGLSAVDQVALCATILAAGNETTRNLLSCAALAFAESPDQLTTLADDPALLKTVPDEMLRWISPVIHFARTALVDSRLGGQTIAAGDMVAMFYASANRDEKLWDSPDRFDVRRVVNPMHIAFGWGEHFCLGASLARIEIRVFFEEFLGRYRQISLAGEPVRPASTLLNGLASLPVMVQA